MSDDQKILTSSAVMAAGTVVSRMSGFVRSALLIAALGNGLHGELFNIANTVPNMLYILLAGGVFNAVLVPQLVRALKNDPDRGQAYTDRVVTLAGLFLALVTVLLVLTAPWVMQIFLSDAYDQPELAAQLESVNNFARWCLPQVFFYGMFVLVGQILNARGRFGPMMWAPIANNVVAIATLVTYLLVYGTASAAEQGGAFTPGQEALLGLGSTLGIVLQLAVLVPYLRSVGYRFQPARRLPRRRPRPHAAARRLDAAVRAGQPGGVRRGGAAGLQRPGRDPRQRPRRDRLPRLLRHLPDRDGPALGRDRLARHRGAAADVRPRRRGRPRRARPHPAAGAAQRAGRDRPVRAAAAAGLARRRPRDLGLRRRQRQLRQLRALARRCSGSAWSSSPSTTSCCAASTPSSRPAPSS